MEKRRSYKVSPYDLALSIEIDETRIVDPSEAQYLVTNNEFPWNSFRVRALSKVFPRGKSIDYTKNDFPFSFLKEIRLLPSVNGLITLRQSRDFSISMDYFSTIVIEDVIINIFFLEMVDSDDQKKKSWYIDWIYRIWGGKKEGERDNVWRRSLTLSTLNGIRLYFWSSMRDLIIFIAF